MKVIGAGLNKTGTTSLAAALRILDYKVYDFMEHATFHRKQWHGLYLDGIEPDFAAMYKDVEAVTDLPSAFWFEEILKAFPDAKVILTERDSDDVWAQSFVKHLVQGSRSFPSWYRLLPTVGKMMNFVTALHHATLGSENLKMSFLYKKKYREHNERVQAVVPASQLLVFNVKEGWEPLCNFLGCNVPSQDFPRSNVAGADLVNSPQVRKFQRQMMKEACLLLSVLVALAAVIVFFITRVF